MSKTLDFKKMDINKLSFNDGEIDSVGFENPNFVVYFRQWNAEPYKLIFKNFLYLEMFEIDTDTNETEIVSESDDIEEVKNRIITGGGKPEGYNYFKFQQINFTSSAGQVYMKVVYQGCVVEAT